MEKPAHLPDRGVATSSGGFALVRQLIERPGNEEWSLPADAPYRWFNDETSGTPEYIYRLAATTAQQVVATVGVTGMQGESTGSRKDNKQILFIHGGGDDGYEADETLAAFLRRELGASYVVDYPQMPDDPTPDFGWVSKISNEIAAISGDVLLVGHSLGASMLLKYLSEHDVPKRISGIFLIATPFWKGDEDWQKGLTLRPDFAAALPKGVPVFLYQSEDDEVVDVSQLEIYAEQLPHATVRRALTGGHQFIDNLAQVVNDIRSLE